MPELETPPNERELGNQRLDGAVVDARVTGIGGLEDPVGDVVVIGEHVQAERSRALVDPVEHGPDRVNCEHPQDRVESPLA